MNNLVEIVVFNPLTHTDMVRQAIGDAGAGIIGNYSHCTFSSIGKGRYKPLEGAKPTIGEVGKYEEVEEERVEFVCPKDKVKQVIEAIKKVYPYEEVALDIHSLLNEEEFNGNG